MSLVDLLLEPREYPHHVKCMECGKFKTFPEKPEKYDLFQPTEVYTMFQKCDEFDYLNLNNRLHGRHNEAKEETS